MNLKIKIASVFLFIGAACVFPVESFNAQSTTVTKPAAGPQNSPTLIAANTGCGFSVGDQSAVPGRPRQNPGRPEREVIQPSVVLVSNHASSDDGDDWAPIVGLWRVRLISENTPGIPDDTVLDDGYVTWHSDGTELMNSSRPPSTGNFCMGVWKQTARSTFKLNHFAMGWDPSGTFFIGPTNIREEVIVDRSGNNYDGTFTIRQFDLDGNVLGHPVTGKVIAHRITVD